MITYTGHSRCAAAAITKCLGLNGMMVNNVNDDSASDDDLLCLHNKYLGFCISPHSIRNVIRFEPSLNCDRLTSKLHTPIIYYHTLQINITADVHNIKY